MRDYFLQIALIQGLFFVIYFIFYKKHCQTQTSRILLLTGVFLSYLLPFVKFPTIPGLQQFNYNSTATILLPEITTGAISVTDPMMTIQSSFSESLFLIWATISILLFMRILVNMIRIVFLRTRATVIYLDNHKIYQHPKITSSFSFGPWIFSHTIDQMIIHHELAHKKYYHTIDLLLLNINQIVFWFNPISWMLIKEMQLIHEYQADAYVVAQHADRSQYIQKLAGISLIANGFKIAPKISSSFYHANILKRINAMKNQLLPVPTWKWFSSSFLISLLLLFFACNDEVMQELQKNKDELSQITFDQLPKELQKPQYKTSRKNSDYLFFVLRPEYEDVEKRKADLSKLNKIDPNTIQEILVDKSRDIYIVTKSNTSLMNTAKEATVTDDVVMIVEEMPEFPGGMGAFYEFIKENLQYPESAKNAGISGRVFVQFVVDKSGNLIDIKTVKGIGNGCDEEAERVLALAPAFKPGYQKGKAVNVRMVLPINFSLE